MNSEMIRDLKLYRICECTLIRLRPPPQFNVITKDTKNIFIFYVSIAEFVIINLFSEI